MGDLNTSLRALRINIEAVCTKQRIKCRTQLLAVYIQGAPDDLKPLEEGLGESIQAAMQEVAVDVKAIMAKYGAMDIVIATMREEGAAQVARIERENAVVIQQERVTSPEDRTKLPRRIYENILSLRTKLEGLLSQYRADVREVRMMRPGLDPTHSVAELEADLNIEIADVVDAAEMLMHEHDTPSTFNILAANFFEVRREYVTALLDQGPALVAHLEASLEVKDARIERLHEEGRVLKAEREAGRLVEEELRTAYAENAALRKEVEEAEGELWRKRVGRAAESKR